MSSTTSELVALGHIRKQVEQVRWSKPVGNTLPWPVL